MGLPPYKVLVCREVLALEKPSRRDRDAILRFLDDLASDPSRNGDFEERDNAGRAVQVKIVGKFALTYWADHPVKEVKVTHIELADLK